MKDLIYKSLPYLSYNNNQLVGDQTLRNWMFYNGDVKCYVQGFKFNPKQLDFYKTVIQIFFDNNKPKEGFLCSKQILDQGNKEEFFYVMGVKNAMKDRNLEEANKLIKEGLAAFPNSEDLILN